MDAANTDASQQQSEARIFSFQYLGSGVGEVCFLIKKWFHCCDALPSGGCVQGHLPPLHPADHPTDRLTDRRSFSLGTSPAPPPPALRLFPRFAVNTRFPHPERNTAR